VAGKWQASVIVKSARLEAQKNEFFIFVTCMLQKRYKILPDKVMKSPADTQKKPLKQAVKVERLLRAQGRKWSSEFPATICLTFLTT